MHGFGSAKQGWGPRRLVTGSQVVPALGPGLQARAVVGMQAHAHIGLSS